jgi:acyl carrier protein
MGGQDKPGWGQGNSTEQRLARIWSDVLGVETVSVGDNFFELGGHSLLAADVTARACQEFDIALPVRALFASPTVRELAVEIERIRKYGSGETPIPRAARTPLPETGPSEPVPHT